MPDNCEDFEDGQCKSCISGHFLGPRIETDDGRDYTTKQENHQDTLVCTKYSFHLNCSKLQKSKDECQECFTGSFKDENNVCVKYPKLENCIKSNKSKSECVQCAFGYFLAANKTCVQTDMPEHCKDFDIETNQCRECFKGFDLDLGNLCQIDNCEEYDHEVRCRRCKDSFALNQDTKKCKYLRNNKCLVFDRRRTRCTLCREGYYSNKDSGFVCYQVNEVENCEKYVENENLCEQCRDSFVLHQSRCIRKIDHCVEYGEDEYCTKCKVGKFLFESSCLDEKYYTWFWNKYMRRMMEKEEKLDIYQIIMLSVLLALVLIFTICFILKKKKLCCFKDENNGNDALPPKRNQDQNMFSLKTLPESSETIPMTKTHSRKNSSDLKFAINLSNKEEVEMQDLEEVKEALS